jgi:hypothetical protein
MKGASRVERVFSGYGGMAAGHSQQGATGGEAALVRATEAVRVAARIRPHTADEATRVRSTPLRTAGFQAHRPDTCTHVGTTSPACRHVQTRWCNARAGGRLVRQGRRGRIDDRRL